MSAPDKVLTDLSAVAVLPDGGFRDEIWWERGPRPGPSDHFWGIEIGPDGIAYTYCKRRAGERDYQFLTPDELPDHGSDR